MKYQVESFWKVMSMFKQPYLNFIISKGLKNGTLKYENGDITHKYTYDDCVYCEENYEGALRLRKIAANILYSICTTEVLGVNFGKVYDMLKYFNEDEILETFPNVLQKPSDDVSIEDTNVPIVESLSSNVAEKIGIDKDMVLIHMISTLPALFDKVFLKDNTDIISRTSDCLEHQFFRSVYPNFEYLYIILNKPYPMVVLFKIEILEVDVDEDTASDQLEYNRLLIELSQQYKI